MQVPVNTISAGSLHAVVLLGNGTVWGWGLDMLGQCGDNRTANSPTVQLIPVEAEVSGVKSISSGGFFTIALMDDGTVWAWGANTWGQLGRNQNDSHPIPAVIPGLSNITSISAGSEFALALKEDGTVWAWGHNEYGQLGDGAPSDQNINSWYMAHRSTPDRVVGLSDIKLISAYETNALAVDGAGNIWAWGGYRLNMSTLNGFSTPARFGVLKNVTAVSRNGFLTSDGRVYVLTFNSSKLTKDPQGVPYDLVEVPGLTNITMISFGRGHCAALKDDGTVWTWGDNSYGQLGDGTNKSRPIPMRVHGLSNITHIAAGDAYTIAISEDGTIWGWGDDSCGQLGDGDSGHGLYKKSPVPAKLTSSMELNTLNVTPIPAASDSNGLPIAMPSSSSKTLVNGLSNSIMLGLIIILLLVCGVLYLALRGKK
ncbi:RCC1 domain-containing protein [Methanocella conradii]|uniref:RCC1 domain-containing protein n=1 Tax=Methanocella conradii TaxID=1175444 RepID=UPI00157D6845|nr:hypothetical protein [Methanocella conradii]